MANVWIDSEVYEFLRKNAKGGQLDESEEVDQVGEYRVVNLGDDVMEYIKNNQREEESDNDTLRRLLHLDIEEVKCMTVRELIEELKKQNQDALIILKDEGERDEGYEVTHLTSYECKDNEGKPYPAVFINFTSDI